MNRQVFVFWTGENALSENRQRSLESMRNTGLEPVLVTGRNLHEYVPAERLHPAYPFLNLAHRADYLRCYFMRHHGGGYSDLKYTESSWMDVYHALDGNPDAWAAGFREGGPRGVADIYLSSRQRREGLGSNIRAQWQWRFLQWHYRKLIGTCAFIFKEGTPLVEEWWQTLNQRLDALYPELEKHPARYPKELPGQINEGVKSRYPVPWTYLLGDILHPLVYQHRERILYDLPAPDFSNYA